MVLEDSQCQLPNWPENPLGPWDQGKTGLKIQEMAHQWHQYWPPQSTRESAPPTTVLSPGWKSGEPAQEEALHAQGLPLIFAGWGYFRYNVAFLGLTLEFQAAPTAGLTRQKQETRSSLGLAIPGWEL